MEGVDVVGRTCRSVRQRRSGTTDDEDSRRARGAPRRLPRRIVQVPEEGDAPKVFWKRVSKLSRGMFIRNRHRRATGGVLRAVSSFPTRLFSAPSKKKVSDGGRSGLKSACAAANRRLPASSGGQVQEKPESGSLLRSPCTADQFGEPQPVAIGPEHHRQCPRHGCVPVSQAEALDHDLFGVRGPPICDCRASQWRAQVTKPAPHRRGRGRCRGPPSHGGTAGEFPSLLG